MKIVWIILLILYGLGVVTTWVVLTYGIVQDYRYDKKRPSIDTIPNEIKTFDKFYFKELRRAVLYSLIPVLHYGFIINMIKMRKEYEFIF